MFVARFHHQTLPSTNAWALNWLRSHELEGPVLVSAAHQTAGRGQRNRSWESEPNRDACFSVILPTHPEWDAPRLNMAVALLVRKALLGWCPPEIDQDALAVKWPNDLLMQDGQHHRKVAGILVDNVWRGSQWNATVIGIGINVQSRKKSSNHAHNAISLFEGWKCACSPEEVVRVVAEKVVREVSHLAVSADVRQAYHKCLFGRDEWRTFEIAGVHWQGVLREITSQGLGKFEWRPNPENEPQPSTELASSEVNWLFSL